MRRRHLGALAAAVAALAGPSTAHAFDTGPHADITRDAMTAEGFGRTAAQVGRIDNWFVDFYSNAEKIPFSGHADLTKLALGGGFIVADHERWSKQLVLATKAGHMDSGSRVLVKGRMVSLRDPVAMEAEWLRLRLATRQLVLKAKRDRSPLELLSAIGISLHPMQDFYSHTNWAETPTAVDGPGWPQLGQGATPTFFDVSKPIRDGVHVYAGGAEGAPRKHGDWADSPKKTVAKDWPGRPSYQLAYMSAYFATRQWVRAIRTWLGDETLWRAAQHYRGTRAAVSREETFARLIASYTGHQYGEGGPGTPFWDDSSGWGGTLKGSREATKAYFRRGAKTILRKTFERMMVPLANPTPRGTAADVPVQPSTPIQADTRFVQLEVLNMRGLGLGDPGPDDADLFARATIAGQDYTSAIIQAHDRFSFPAPYHAFTFLKAVGRERRRAEPIESMQVRVRTSRDRGAGTDADVFLRVGNRRFPLDKRLYDDFERGDDDTYSVPIDDAARRGLDRGDITRIGLETAGGGSWKLGGVSVTVNGEPLYRKERVERWLEGSRRAWRAPDFRPQAAAGPRLGVWLRLDDDDLISADDVGDINPDDARDAVNVAYMPGTLVTRTTRGGNRYGGRLGKGGDHAEVRYRIDTLEPALPKPPVVDPAPTGPKPNLVIEQIGLQSFRVRNLGFAPAGPFTARVANVEYRFAALGAGESATRTYGNKCGGVITGYVDTKFEVAESVEDDNGRTELFVC